MLRVLFVDDEVRVLDGLRRQLREMRGEWEMDFMESARGALAMAAERRWDVVVSDMRMPEMSGADFLTEMREVCPSSVRIVLSGHADPDATLKATSVTHQYLAKPCDTAVLKTAIESALARRPLLERSSLLTLMNRIDSLPKLPAVLHTLSVDVRRPGCTIASVAAIVSEDPGLSAEILKLANSAFFRTSSQVTSAEWAISVIGLSNLISLVVSAVLKQGLRNPNVPLTLFDEVWHHSTLATHNAATIARLESCPKSVSDAATSAALLHDIGKLIFLANLWPEYAAAMKGASDGNGHISEHEAQVFGATHAELGAYLLGLWNLPPQIVDTVRHHSDPACAPSSCADVLALMSVADALASETSGRSLAAADHGEDILARAGLRPRWDIWRAAVNVDAATTQ